MATTPENLPRWADTSATYYIEASTGKKDVGWLSEEKPPYQYMNWLHYSTYTWLNYLSAIASEQASSFEIRSDHPISYASGNISFTSDIEIRFREGATTYSNTIPLADSPIAIADGEVLILKKSTASGSVVLGAGTYGALNDGEYVVVAESSLTADEAHLETTLFIRRDVSAGNDVFGVGYSKLEIPTMGQEFKSGSYFYSGDENYNSALHVPVGTIVAHYDFNGTLAPDLDHWAYCDGSAANIYTNGVASAQTLPDMSNRYCVGFGTEGGGDVDSAAWSTTVQGLASHQANLQHSHTVNSHTHTISTHTHTISADGGHDHSNGTLVAEVTVGQGGGGGLDGIYSNQTAHSYTATHRDDAGTESTVSQACTQGANVSGSTDSVVDHDHGGTTGADSSGSTGGEAPLTDNQLSTTQSVQPRSIMVRWVMRYK